LENFSLLILSAIGFLIIIFNAILWRKVRRFEKIFDDPYEEKNSKILLQNTSSALKKLDKDIQELYEINSSVSKITKRGICKVGLARFNAFSEKSGNQSFAVTMLDFRDSGIVFSSLQTTKGARLFIKPIQNGEPINGAELLAEEKKALERAKQVVF